MPRLIKKLLDSKTFKTDKSWYWLEVKWELQRFFEYTRPFSWLKKAKWWLKYRFHPNHRYHIVDSRLKPGYYDRDWVLLNVSFAILCDFIEKELPWSAYDEFKKIPWWYPTKWYLKKHAERLAFEHLDWKMAMRMKSNDCGEDDPTSDLQINHENTWGWAAKEMKELYLWWKYGRDREHEYVGYDFKLEQSLDEKDDTQLMRLVKIRNFMWT
jgi:hypothetical protein